MKDVEIPKMSYVDFSKKLHEEIADSDRPADGMIEVTHRCNFRCVHCYVPHNSLKPELSTQELYEIIDVLTDEGCMWLAFTGGEPFVRSDFLEVYTYAKKKGLIVSILTNGSLITPKIADHLRDYPPFQVSMTIYGITKEIYEKVTGSSVSYDLSMRAIDLLLEHNLPLELKTVAIRQTKHEFWEIKRFAEQLGVKFRYDTFINAHLDGLVSLPSVRLSPEEIVDILALDKKVADEMKEFCCKFWGPPSASGTLFNCGAGKNSFVIDPYGELIMCLSVRHPSYSLRGGDLQHRFREGFYRCFPQIRSTKVQHTYRCMQCELINLCNYCPGHAQLEYGDPEAPMEYACQIAHLLAQKLGLGGQLS